jgi:Rieske Fe-S protein
MEECVSDTREKNTPKPSRLDPKPLPRRDFLGICAMASAGAALTFASVGALRLPSPGVLPSPPKKIKVSLPETLAPGIPFLVGDRPVALLKDDEGVYAVSLICTHLGCVVKPSETGFDCPCHGSRFGRLGEVLKGPAPKALVWHPVKKVGDGTYVVDLGARVPQGTKVGA